MEGGVDRKGHHQKTIRNILVHPITDKPWDILEHFPISLHHNLRWRRDFGQLAKVGSTSLKDGLYDWEAEEIFG